jgi:hypothetical protein
MIILFLIKKIKDILPIMLSRAILPFSKFRNIIRSYYNSNNIKSCKNLSKCGTINCICNIDYDNKSFSYNMNAYVTNNNILHYHIYTSILSFSFVVISIIISKVPYILCVLPLIFAKSRIHQINIESIAEIVSSIPLGLIGYNSSILPFESFFCTVVYLTFHRSIYQIDSKDPLKYRFAVSLIINCIIVMLYLFIVSEHDEN